MDWPCMARLMIDLIGRYTDELLDVPRDMIVSIFGNVKYGLCSTKTYHHVFVLRFTPKQSETTEAGYTILRETFRFTERRGL